MCTHCSNGCDATAEYTLCTVKTHSNQLADKQQPVVLAQMCNNDVSFPLPLCLALHLSYRPAHKENS